VVVARPNQTAADRLQVGFDDGMAAFAPFEEQPHLAVAVSGGPDSMALAVLARNWVGRRGGTLTALVVDHGLRTESSAEASCVRRRLQGLNISTEILVWSGDKPVTGIQAAARTERYALLANWCARHGVLHLLTGHHVDDQVETIAMRAERRSGLDGLAGMSAIVEWPRCRLLRPLLGQSRDELRVYLCDHGISWIDDPSNSDIRFERARLRRAPPPDLVQAREIARAGDLRLNHEHSVLQVLANSMTLHPFGFCAIEISSLESVAAQALAGALSRVVGWIGGRAYRPGPSAAIHLCDQIRHLAPGHAATLGGCLVRREKHSLIVTRETGRLPGVSPVTLGSGFLWDGRFWIEAGQAGAREVPVEIGPLRHHGWKCVEASVSKRLAADVPKSAIWALPALWIDGEVAAVPHLLFNRDAKYEFSAVFRPQRTLFSPTFAVA
jgi:tRNA(Ile)-lysidine synthase